MKAAHPASDSPERAAQAKRLGAALDAVESALQDLAPDAELAARLAAPVAALGQAAKEIADG